MAPSSKRNQKRRVPREVNLVSARSASYSDVTALSRNYSAGNYAKIRAKRARNKAIFTVGGVVLVAAALALVAAFSVYQFILKPQWDANMARDPVTGEIIDYKSGIYENLFTPRASAMEPFWMLLLGVDDYEPDDPGRSDTMLLAYVDPQQKKVALISIPRDLRVYIPGFWTTKINAAHSYGEGAHNSYLNGMRDTDLSGISLATETVKQLAGVDIAYTVKINFFGFKDLVDSLGGVYVDVPMRIDDRDAGPEPVEAGYQRLDGVQALTFVRSRQIFGMGDYQRQANQRTFLQALAKQLLNADPPTIIASMTSLTSMVDSNMTVDEIINLALAFRGINESDIITYTTPSYPQEILENDLWISYVILDESNWRNMIYRIGNGEFPEPTTVGLTSDYLGVAPDGYHEGDQLNDKGGILTDVQCAQFVVDVRNGFGLKGAATSVSDMLFLAGYQQGEIGNTNQMVYDQTLIIYQAEADRPAAEDIARRLGYGKVFMSQGRYTFSGDVLVIVGADFPHSG